MRVRTKDKINGLDRIIEYDYAVHKDGSSYLCFVKDTDFCEVECLTNDVANSMMDHLLRYGNVNLSNFDGLELEFKSNGRSIKQ